MMTTEQRAIRSLLDFGNQRHSEGFLAGLDAAVNACMQLDAMVAVALREYLKPVREEVK